MKVEYFVTGPDQDCGIATYTTALERAVDVEYHRTALRLRSLNVAHYIRQAIQAGRTEADIIHVQHEYDIYGPKSLWSWLVFPILWVMTRLRGRSLVVTFHSAWSEETVDPPLMRLKWLYLVLNNRMLAAVTDHGIFLSEKTRTTFEETARLGSVEVMSHGVPTDLRPMPRERACERLGLDPDNRIVAEPGFVRPQKGYHTFLDIAERVEEAVFVVGGGTQESAYEEYMSDLRRRCGTEVPVTGVLDDEQFHALFNAVDLVLLPYESVTQSGILNWCLAYEVPVVASDVDEFEVMAEEYGFPVVFPADDPDAGAQAVRATLADTNRVLDAMRTYRNEHGMDEVAARTVKTYERLVRTGTGFNDKAKVTS